jgi:thiamine-phosphate pyrophosphorylase
MEGRAGKEGGLKIAGLTVWKEMPSSPSNTPVMTDTAETARLYLVAPPRIELADFAPRLQEALAAGDIAAILLAMDEPREDVLAPLVATIQQAGAAALVADDTRLAGHVKADGVHIAGGLDELRLAVDSFRPKRIVGAGNLSSRHAAMQAGELDIDYLFFGRPHGDTHDTPHPKALELAEWWSALMQVPAVMMAGRSLDSVADAAATGAEFIALHAAIWSHPQGPGEAVRKAAATLAQAGRRAA